MSIAPQRPDTTGRTAGCPGSVDAPRPGERLLPERHACLPYDDPDELGREVRRFLGEGLARSDRAQVLLDGPAVDRGVADAAALLEGMPERDRALADGSLELVEMPASWREQPELAITYFQREAERAVAEGFAGLTVAVDATTVAAGEEHRTDWVAHEHLLDHWMTGAAFAALCAYDHRRIGEEALQLAAVHPTTNHVVDFQVYAAHHGWLRLTGAVDALNVHLFEDVLDAVGRRPGCVHVDAQDLQYINQRGLLALDALAERVELVTDDAQILRLARSLRMTHLEVLIG